MVSESILAKFVNKEFSFFGAQQVLDWSRRYLEYILDELMPLILRNKQGEPYSTRI